jgi:hypothetical protein
MMTVNQKGFDNAFDIVRLSVHKILNKQLLKKNLFLEMFLKAAQ